MTPEDICGHWLEDDQEYDLAQRVREYWRVPITDMPDGVLAMYLRQRIAVGPVLAEARQRLALGRVDDSELWDGELAEAVERATGELCGSSG